MSPEQIGVKYEAIKIDDNQGPQLYGWFLPSEGLALGTILHLHGNAQNISSHFASIYWLPSRSYNVLTIDYRGYGQSKGRADMKGVHEDAQRAVDYLGERLAGQTLPLFLFGQSLGASIAIYTAARPENEAVFNAVIVESPFASYRGIAREKLRQFWLTWPLQYPLAWTISSAFDPIKVIDRVSPTPLLIIHPEHDEIVSVENSRILFESAYSPKELWIAKEGEHIQVMQNEENRQRFLQFLKDNS